MQKTVKAITWLKCLGREFLPKEVLQNLREKWELKFRVEINLQPELQWR